MFCCFFAVVGIPLTWLVLAAIGNNLYHLINHGMKTRLRAYGLQDKSPKSKGLRAGIYPLIGTVVFVLGPAAVFSRIEDWDYTESFYYAVITLCTIGLGDFIPGKVLVCMSFPRMFHLQKQGKVGSLQDIARAHLIVWIFIIRKWCNKWLKHVAMSEGIHPA